VDEAGFAALFEAHYGAVVAYARRRGVSWDEAHDVAAEVFRVAWRRSQRVPPEAPRPWLLAVARRCLANHRRAGLRWRGLVDRAASAFGAAPPPPGPEDVATDTADEELARALASLPARDREVLWLVAWDGLTHAEVARVLGISASGVSNRVVRARARLRRALGEPTDAEVGGP
jgi:RNA polymerase sigma-70 factor (ECF subfamily)